MKRVITYVSVAALIFTTFVIPQRESLVTEIQAAEITSYQQQLSGNSQIFYKQMQEMYDSGKMKSGVGSVDVSNLFPQDLLAQYANGDGSLAKSFQDARDAFMQDHVEIFYVDMTKLSLRLGKLNNSFVLLIGNGSYENYYREGFTSETQVNSAIEELNQKKKAIMDTISKDQSDAAIVTSVHNALTNEYTYTYPQDATSGLAVDTMYGALVGKQANCDGYARTFKSILDAYGIESMLVNGNAVNSEGVGEAHVWNYVKVESTWFGVDVTWDDPIGGSPRDMYLLRGKNELSKNHFPFGQISLGGKDFVYPELSNMDYETIKNSNTMDIFEDTTTDLKVTTSRAVDKDKVVYTEYTITYKGMSINDMKANGLVLAGRFANAKNDGKFLDWVDMDSYSIYSEGDITKLQISAKGALQLCVTTKQKPKDALSYGALDLSTNGNNIALTKKIATPYYSDYVSSPFIRKSEPNLGMTINAMETKHYTVEYDEELVKIEDAIDVTMNIDSTQPHINAQVNNLKFTPSEFTNPQSEGEIKKSTIVEFDFVPDKSYQSYFNQYTLTLKNIQGKNSKKEPVPIGIATNFAMYIPCPSHVVAGSVPKAFVVGNPTLVVNDKMDIFETAAGKANSMDIRLIASIPNESDKKVLEDTLASSIDKEIKAKATYDLSLTCSQYLGRLKAVGGMNYQVTIALPYPAGFNYNDNKDVQFEAYHYKKQDDGTYKTQKLICQITPQGLIVIADDFSPFSIIATTKDPNATVDKTISVSSQTAGGHISTLMNSTSVGASGLYTYGKDETSKSFDITADDGYVIEQILVNGERVALKGNETSYTQTFTKGNGKDETIMEVSYVAKSVVTKEEAASFNAIVPEFIAASDDADVSNKVVFKDNTVTNDNKLVSISGKLLDGVTLNVDEKNVPEVAKTAFKEYAKEKAVLNMMEVSLSNDNGYLGELGLQFNLDPVYNGKEVEVLHYVNNKVEAQKVIVKDGVAMAKVTSLSPFAIITEKVITPTPEVKPSPETKPEVKPSPEAKPEVKPSPETKPEVKPTPDVPANADAKMTGTDTGDETNVMLLINGAVLCFLVLTGLKLKKSK